MVENYPSHASRMRTRCFHMSDSAAIRRAAAAGVGSAAMSFGAVAARGVNVPKAVWVAFAVAAITSIVYAVFLSFRKDAPMEADQSSVTAGHDAFIVTGGSGGTAGRDMDVSQGPATRERRRWVMREITDCKRTIDAWAVRRDCDHILYLRDAPLPTGQWEQHGAALELSPSGLALAESAYSGADDFNERRADAQNQRTFGPGPETPDLIELSEAFDRAVGALDGCGPPTAVGPVS